MVLALDPEPFTLYGEEYTPDNPIPEDGDPWTLPEIGIDVLRVNPRYLVEPDALAFLDVWFAYRGGGMGRGPLPDAGGYLDQAAWTMDAFRICFAVASAVERRDT